MPQITTRPLYRLTLSHEAFKLIQPRLKYLSLGYLMRGDRIDVPISMGLLDQLKTAALPRENLSDTIVRIHQKTGGTKP